MYYYGGNKEYIIYTFSPISVKSPPARIFRSGNNAHASITFWYFLSV